ncbi:MAG: RNA methyltransferase [Rhodospirillales bacterium]|nr:RNA methyltransferase [Rhodospirillales bacterium]
MADGMARRGGQYLGNHQRSWLWGRNLVLETLRAGRWPVIEAWIADDVAPAPSTDYRRLAAGLDLRVDTAARARLTKLCGADDHQGFAIRVGPYPYATPADLRYAARTPGLWLALDGVMDSFNLGAALRSAEVFGVDGVVLGAAGQTGVNSQAARSSAGAVNRLRIARVDDLAAALAALRADGVAVVGTSLDTDFTLDAAPLDGPLALVVGNEARGLSPETAAVCDRIVRIPQDGASNSLNVAAATAVCLYEIRRRRRAVTPAPGAATPQSGG